MGDAEGWAVERREGSASPEQKIVKKQNNSFVRMNKTGETEHRL